MMDQINWQQLLIGLALCLSGWALYWVGLHLASGLVGAALASGAVWFGAELAKVEPEQLHWALPLAAVCGFALGAYTMRGLHRFIFFFVGAAAGLAFGRFAFDSAAAQFEAIARDLEIWRTVFYAGGSVVGGLIVVRSSRRIVILAASATGAMLVVTSFEDALALLAFPPLLLASLFVQSGRFRSLGTPKRPYRDDEEEDD